MKPQLFIFIGRSGCGKGTQIKMLAEVLQKRDPEHGILLIQTGEEFRHFIEGNSLTQNKTKEIYKVGGLMPEFLTAAMWTKPLIEKYTGNEHIFFDGTPRRYHEAGVLDSVVDFYGLGKPWVIDIHISPEEATKRLLMRKRMDDTVEDIKKRLGWYDTYVVPTINYYRDNRDYQFLEIDGERPMEAIHADIVQKLALG